MGAVRRIKTKRRTRDYDQVKADLQSPRHLERYKETKADEDLPGLGQFYCVECAKWFEGEWNLKAHTKGKNHKKRVKVLREEGELGHSQRVAERAVGLGVDDGKKEGSGRGGGDADTMVEG